MDIAPLISQALAELGERAPRREKVFALAQVWHRHTGKLPTVAATRQFVVKGSYTDIGHDLRDFAATTVTQRERLLEAPGLPEDLNLQYGDLLSKLWLAATEKANADFEAEKAELQVRMDDLASKNEQLAAERLQALTDRSNALEALAAEQKQVVALKAAISILEDTASDDKTTISQLQARIGEQETEKLRTKAKHDTEVQGLWGTLKERENRIIDLQAMKETLRAAYEEKLSAAIALEGEHRIRANNADQGRQAALNTLETAHQELANLSGQLSGLTARNQELETSRDDSVGRIAVLTHDLQAERTRAQNLLVENDALRVEGEKNAATIGTLQSRVADLENRVFGKKQ